MRGRGLAVPGMAAVAELAREAGAVLLADEPERDVAHHVTGLAKGAEQVEGVTLARERPGQFEHGART